jgi:hypothetical protein
MVDELKAIISFIGAFEILVQIGSPNSVSHYLHVKILIFF